MATSEEAKPHPMVKPEIPRVLMGAGGYLTNEERIKQDEEELLSMKKEALGITDEESTEVGMTYTSGGMTFGLQRINKDNRQGVAAEEEMTELQLTFAF